MDMLVSVIIPVYNVAPYLREALDSVIGQTYQNLEILIIDDGSTDRSGSICDEYKSDLRVVVVHQKNGGLSNARNAGLDLAKGEFVCFLDPDDAYDTSFVEKMLEVMVLRHPDIVVCRFSICNTTGRLNDPSKKRLIRVITYPSMKEGEYSRDDALRALIDGGLDTSVWNKMYKRSLWDRIRFPDGHNHEDLDTFYRVLDICSFVSMTGQLLYFHRIRPGSITRSYTKQNGEDFDLAHRHLFRYVETNTPGVFSASQMSRRRLSCLNTMMLRFANIKGDEEYKKYLKTEVVGKAKEIDHWNFRSRVAYCMVRHCPWLLKISYPVYLSVKQLIWRINGR